MSQATDAEGGWDERLFAVLARNPGWRRYFEEASRLLEEIARVDGVEEVTVESDSRTHSIDKLDTSSIGAPQFAIIVKPTGGGWTHEYYGSDVLSAIRDAHDHHVPAYWTTP